MLSKIRFVTDWQKKSDGCIYKCYYFNNELDSQFKSSIELIIKNDPILKAFYPDIFRFHLNDCLIFEGNFKEEQKDSIEQIVNNLLASHAITTTTLEEERPENAAVEVQNTPTFFVKPNQYRRFVKNRNLVSTEDAMKIAYEQLIKAERFQDPVRKLYGVRTRLNQGCASDFKYLIEHIIFRLGLGDKLINNRGNQKDKMALIFNDPNCLEIVLDALGVELGLKEDSSNSLGPKISGSTSSLKRKAPETTSSRSTRHAGTFFNEGISSKQFSGFGVVNGSWKLSKSEADKVFSTIEETAASYNSMNKCFQLNVPLPIVPINYPRYFNDLIETTINAFRLAGVCVGYDGDILKLQYKDEIQLKKVITLTKEMIQRNNADSSITMQNFGS